MNMLNSVSIEGFLDKDPVSSNEVDNQMTCTFNVVSVRKDHTTKKTEKIIAGIVTTGHLAGSCAEYLKTGRGVRVVGRLAGYPFLFINAQRVEFKPETREIE
jgi:single-strand DNA-binding protein